MQRVVECIPMAMTVSTKDTTALSDAELAEMADLCVDREPNFDIGFLSKQREDWVLVTQVREGNKLRGYSFCTLERIGGTPSLLVGLLLVDRNAKSDQTLKAILHDQFRRALLAFPDEDVLLGSRLTSPDGFRAFAGLEDVVPRLGYKPTGEDRAWGRRLAKRFGSEKSIDDKTFIMTVTPGPVGGLDYTASKGPIPDGVVDVLHRPQGRKRASAWSSSAGPWPSRSPRANCPSSSAARQQSRCSSCSSGRRWAWTASSTRRSVESRAPRPGPCRRVTVVASPPSCEWRARPHRAATRRPRTSRSAPTSSRRRVGAAAADRGRRRSARRSVARRGTPSRAHSDRESRRADRRPGSRAARATGARDVRGRCRGAAAGPTSVTASGWARSLRSMSSAS